MAREIPEVVRAVAGLAATVLDEARKLPAALPALPVRIVGLAMQQAMKVQQHYAGLVARGDELFTGIRGEDEPGLATFDDEEPASAPGFRDSAFDRAGADVDSARESIEELAEDAPGTAEILDELAVAEDQPTTDVSPTVDVLAPDGEVTTTDATVTDEGIAAVEAPAGDVGTTTDAGTATDEDAAVDQGGATQPTAAEPGRPSAEAMAASARAARAAPIVVHEGEERVDDAIGGGASPSETGSAGRADDTAPAVDEGGTTVAVATDLGPGATAPVEGYDDFSVAQLRGRLRGYAPATVEALIGYEEASLAREPYLRMLRNRLERLQADNA
ncbi:MAG: lipid droplet-associated protein [Geodermatophilales bacterium]|nr:lipid droplet-associated protein [Geodermatophilales bacterium]